MKQTDNNLDTIAENIREVFSAKDARREQVLPLCREVIRYASTTIRTLHRHEFEAAAKLVSTARDLLTHADEAAGDSTGLKHTGFFRDAQKEFAEASLTLALVTGAQLPSPDELGVEPAAYLNGLGEAVGELRRYLLDSIRREDLSRVEEFLSDMDDIYNILVTMDYPDAITGGLRRTTDMVRGILERTRSDLTLIMQQNRLEAKLRTFENKI